MIVVVIVIAVFLVYILYILCVVCVSRDFVGVVSSGVGRSPGYLGEEAGVDSGDHTGRSLSMAISARLSISREASFLPFPAPVCSEFFF